MQASMPTTMKSTGSENSRINQPDQNQKAIPRLRVPQNFDPSQLRLQPVEQAHGLFMRLVYAISKHTFGKVLLIIKVIYYRDPSLFKISRSISSRMQKSKLPGKHTHLIQAIVSMANGCAFCYDLSLAMAMQNKIGTDHFADLANFEKSSNYDEKLKAMLAAALAVNACQLDDAIWQRLRTHCSEAECLEVIWLATAEGYYNRLNHALEIPAEGLTEHY